MLFHRKKIRVVLKFWFLYHSLPKPTKNGHTYIIGKRTWPSQMQDFFKHTVQVTYSNKKAGCIICQTPFVSRHTGTSLSYILWVKGKKSLVKNTNSRALSFSKSHWIVLTSALTQFNTYFGRFWSNRQRSPPPSSKLLRDYLLKECWHLSRLMLKYLNRYFNISWDADQIRENGATSTDLCTAGFIR